MRGEVTSQGGGHGATARAVSGRGRLRSTADGPGNRSERLSSCEWAWSLGSSALDIKELFARKKEAGEGTLRAAAAPQDQAPQPPTPRGAPQKPGELLRGLGAAPRTPGQAFAGSAGHCPCRGRVTSPEEPREGNGHRRGRD